jgi:hypothetical protein
MHTASSESICECGIAFEVIRSSSDQVIAARLRTMPFPDLDHLITSSPDHLSSFTACPEDQLLEISADC